MSCEENRFKYFEKVASAGGPLASTMGGEVEARAVLEQIFNTARNDGAGIRSPLQQSRAAGRTLQLFEEMEQRHGLSRPTHSTQGMRLPRRDAQFGYQAVYDTIEAARVGKPLPDVAVRVLRQRQLRRAVSSLRVDDHGYYRCSNCGQFASRTRGHMCPFTATSGDLERALHRRLGTPSGAYVCTDAAGQRVDGLQELIDAARPAQGGTVSTAGTAGTAGTVRMAHCLTGEEVDVTLDGTIPALSQGFVPSIWVGRPGLRRVELPDRRVVAVLNADGLNAIHPHPASVLGGHASAGGSTGQEAAPRSMSSTVGVVRTAAAAYGTILAPDTPVRSLGADTPLQWVPPASLSALRSALTRSGVPSGKPGKPVLLKPTTLQGGVAYDWGHFTGTEYRKGGWHGVPVEACGRTYKVGDRSSDPHDWAQARRSGAEPAPKGGVAVGRTLVAAVDLLSKGQVAVTRYGIQLYNADGSELVAVYDPAAETAGDMNGTPNASPEQMAALIAYWEHTGRTRPDTASTAVRSLVSDLDALRRGGGSPLAVADSAYLVLRDHLGTGSTLTLGAQVSTPRCPDCGRWMGDVHNCPARVQAEEHPEQAEAQPQVAVPVPAIPEVADVPNVPDIPSPKGPADSSEALTGAPVDTERVASPTDPGSPLFAQALTQAFDRFGEKLGDRLGAVLGDKLGDRLIRPPDVQPTQSSDGSVSLPESRSPADERMASALDRLATVLQEWSARGTAAPVPDGSTPGTEEPQSRRRTASRGAASGDGARPFASPAGPAPPAPPASPVRPPLDALPLTPQEHILKHVKPPEPPDPYLSRLDPSLGGRRTEPLPLHYEEIDPSYDVGASAERALRIVSSSLQIAWDGGRRKGLRGTQMRVFGFAGTAGTGKNTTARQIAASLGLPYYETTLHRDTSLQEEIGQTVLQDGTSLPRLGPLGQAAAAGGVICINELVKANPGTLGALQRMMEDGVFEVQGTEAGMAAKEIPVHPSTVFICTWNPGYDGSSDRPDAALLSRIPTIRMDAPDIKDETRRLLGSLEALFGDEAGDPENAEGLADGKAARQKQERRHEILGRDYGITRKAPSPERVEIAVRFVRDLRNLAQTRQIGASSRHLLEPTPREALHFAAMCEATGDPLLALEQFKIYCDSGEGYDEQFKLVQQIFKRYYGEDGQALNRRSNGDGPQAS
jgi:MoxR-like ATPase